MGDTCFQEKEETDKSSTEALTPELLRKVNF